MANLNYNGQIIEQRISDNYVNLTQMAKANDARLDNWQQSPETQKYLKALQESDSLKSGVSVIEVKSVGFPATRTTCWHTLVALHFAQWINAEFHLWCNQNIQTLMTTGTVSLLVQPEQPKLPSEDKAVKVTEAVAYIQDVLGQSNPRLAQFLIDYAISDIMPAGTALTGAKLKGVAEIAEQMGFSVGLNNRSQLGKFVKSRCGELAQQEQRLVNGQTRNVACYPEDSDVVKQAIIEFFS